ncbi:LAMI_0D05072g1_1 [Lachancea mirantina]|uniref:LSM complex subunit LSM4 n=1 Tax=Lachancea mirantina TaxID=1230905 RepID=A0A1G4JBJ0_9SACH|nr:LAMI_0D05072g1_1 [Lachancea mirantina]
MLPLYLLTNSNGQHMLIELKNGDTVQGQLTNVDNWMNLTLADVTHTASNEVITLPEIYVRGNFIKYIKLQQDVIEKVKQSSAQQQSQGHHQNRDFRRRQGGGGNRRDNDRRFNQGGNQKRNEGRGSHYNGGNRRYNNQRQSNDGNHSSAMGGFVQHHQTSAQQPASLGHN